MTGASFIGDTYFENLKLCKLVPIEINLLSLQKTNNMSNNIIPCITKVLTQADIQKLYPLVNSERGWKIDVNSHKLVDKIIELWFETQGYDFWDNPYPDVTEWTVNKDNEIKFTYVNQN